MEKREQRQEARLGELRQRFVEGPVLVLPSAGGGTFDARGATLIPGSATVHFFELQRQGSLPYGHFDKVVPNRHRWVAANVSAYFVDRRVYREMP